MSKRCTSGECECRGVVEVPYEGNVDANIVWIGESPGREENRLRKPWRGPAGDLIKATVREAGLNWTAAFRMNASRCLINKKKLNGKQITHVLKCCRSNVVRAIYRVKPKLIICLGDIAMRQVLKKSGVGKNRAKFLWNKEFGCWTFVTYHPAAILRDPGKKRTLVEDIKMVRWFVGNGFREEKKEKKRDYRSVSSIEDFLEGRKLAGKVVGFDTETQGLDWMSRNFVMISYSLSWKDNQGVNVRLYEECKKGREHWTIRWLRTPEENKKKRVLTDVFVRRMPGFAGRIREMRRMLKDDGISKYMINGNFDLHALQALARRERLKPFVVRGYRMDLQAGAHVIDENNFTLASMERIQQSWTDIRHDNTKALEDAGYQKDDMLAVPEEDMCEYACFDSDVTRQSAVGMKKELVKMPTVARYMAKFVMPTLVKSLYVMEENGAFIDQDALPEVMASVKKDMDAAHKIALAVVPKDVKDDHTKLGVRLSRDEFVRAVLFGRDGFDLSPLKKTKSGNDWSVDKEVRKRLLEKSLSRKATAFIEALTEWSELNTMYTRYLKGFEKNIKEDGRIHSSYSMAIAVTGRLSSRKPNMMNNPKRSKQAGKIRRLIAAPPGWLLLAADQSQSELRWAAHCANEKAMMRVFQQGRDIHTETAKELTGAVKWDKLGKKELEKGRRDAKAVNFGLLFLMSAAGFVKYAKLEYGIDITEVGAEKWIRIFFKKYPGLPVYHRTMIEFARRYGYVESPLGRRRRLPGINSKDVGIRHLAERQAVNQPIQSPSSDVVLMANNSIIDTDPNPEEFLQCLFIHDELIFQVKDNSKVEDYGKLVKYHMENPPLERDFGLKLRVPLVTDVKVGPNAAEMEELKL